MKAPPIALVLLLTIAACLGDAAQALYTEGQRAYLAGDVETAKTKFEQAIALDPKNIQATNSLRMIRAAEARDGGAKTKRDLSKLILPKVELNDASLGSVLEYLRQKAEALGGEKINFVSQLSPAENETKVTLSLSNIPMSEVLNYVGKVALVEFRVEPHAIVVKALSPSSAVVEPKP